MPNKLYSARLAISVSNAAGKVDQNPVLRVEATKEFRVEIKTVVGDSQAEVLPEDGRKIQLTFGIKVGIDDTKKYEGMVPTEL